MDILTHLDAATPPAGLDPPRLALWHGLRGDWERAHRIVQDASGAEAAWVHAWLHRVEGDLGNADYWYRRAGRPMGQGDTQAEGRAMAAELAR